MTEKEKRVVKYLIDLNKRITSDQFKSKLSRTIELDKWNIALMKSKELERSTRDIIYLRRRE